MRPFWVQGFDKSPSGVKTEGPMAPEIPLDRARPAQYVFDSNVQLTLSQIRANEARDKTAKAAQTSVSAA